MGPERRSRQIVGPTWAPKAHCPPTDSATLVPSVDLAGRCILVVEDDPLIRMDVAQELEHARASVLSAADLPVALALADDPNLEAAVLDFDLGQADSSAVCRKLVGRRIPFLFYTGRSYPALAQWPVAPVILKPAVQRIVAAVSRLLP